MNEKELIKSESGSSPKKISLLVFLFFFLLDFAILLIYSLIEWPSETIYTVWGTSYYRQWTPLCILEAVENIPYVAIPILAIGIILAVIFLRTKSNLTVTDKRVYGCGIFGKRVDLPLDSISAVGTINLYQGVLVSTSSGSIKFFGVKNYQDIHNTISNLLLERQYGKENFKKKTVEEADNIPELIMQYKKLLDEKLITQEEFDTKKKELLHI